MQVNNVLQRRYTFWNPFFFPVHPKFAHSSTFHALTSSFRALVVFCFAISFFLLLFFCFHSLKKKHRRKQWNTLKMVEQRMDGNKKKNTTTILSKIDFSQRDPHVKWLRPVDWNWDNPMREAVRFLFFLCRRCRQFCPKWYRELCHSKCSFSSFRWSCPSFAFWCHTVLLCGVCVSMFFFGFAFVSHKKKPLPIEI